VRWVPATSEWLATIHWAELDWYGLAWTKSQAVLAAWDNLTAVRVQVAAMSVSDPHARVIPLPRTTNHEESK
jgi:hypothetical protein